MNEKCNETKIIKSKNYFYYNYFYYFSIHQIKIAIHKSYDFFLFADWLLKAGKGIYFLFKIIFKIVIQSF